MLVLHFKDRTWVCRQNEWTELMQLARVGGFDLAGSSDPEDTIFSNAESSRLRAALFLGQSGGPYDAPPTKSKSRLLTTNV